MGDYFRVLEHGLHSIDNQINELKMRNMSAEDKKKHELILQQQREFKEELKKK